VQLKEPTHVTTEALEAIAARHGIATTAFVLLPNVGIINSIYLVGDDLVLRVPRNHPDHVNQLRIEAIAAPVAKAAGVRTPRVVAFDDACDLLPVPYMLVERVHGDTLGLLDVRAEDTPITWEELGQDLAILHTRVARASPAGSLRSQEDLPSPLELAHVRADEGWFTSHETKWLVQWLEKLAPLVTSQQSESFLHCDVQSTNVLVKPGSHEYLALLDWGSAKWGDISWDFGGVPMQAVPWLLKGHNKIAKLDDDIEARILWRRMQMILLVMPRGAAEGLSWAERPIAWLLDLMRFLMNSPSEEWERLRP
jgi:aminoglycoside phosphotransferase (APT) family kinase protein